MMDTCEWVCGDGYYDETTEECDDGNSDNLDGCSDECYIETDPSMYVCKNSYSTDPATTCTSICGDGYLALDEDCDDGNLINADG